MNKFKFNYLNQTLAYQKPFSDYWHETTETFEGSFGSLGFKLTDGWISFTIYERKIRVFYKQVFDLNSDDFWEPAPPLVCYRKDLFKQKEVIFSFSEKDQVEKVAGSWVKKKGEPTM